VKNNRIYVETGFENYDGQGHLTNTYSESHTHSVVHTSGTYAVAPDCEATATYAGGDGYRLEIAPDGSTFSWLQTKGVRGADLFGGNEHRISEIPNYTLSPKPRARPVATRAAQARGATTATRARSAQSPFGDPVPPAPQTPPSIPPPPPDFKLQPPPPFQPPTAEQQKAVQELSDFANNRRNQEAVNNHCYADYQNNPICPGSPTPAQREAAVAPIPAIVFP
jgi:hypothetical protein